jgi:hypothetical protein
MEQQISKHWTAESTEAFAHRISADFILQLEKKMEGLLNQNEFAKRLKLTKGRVSQVLNNPGNLTLKRMVQYSRALGMKVAVTAYDDGDPENENGPINSEIFYRCWQKCGSPKNFFQLHENITPIRSILIEYVPAIPKKSADTSVYMFTLRFEALETVKAHGSATNERTIIEPAESQGAEGNG